MSRIRSTAEAVQVGVGAVSFDEVLAVTRCGAAVSLTDEAKSAIHRARAVVEELAAAPTPSYGISTGFGALATRHIPTEMRAQLLADLLSHQITPVVHEYGSLGCSGDLAPLSHCALSQAQAHPAQSTPLDRVRKPGSQGVACVDRHRAPVLVSRHDGDAPSGVPVVGAEASEAAASDLHGCLAEIDHGTGAVENGEA